MLIWEMSTLCDMIPINLLSLKQDIWVKWVNNCHLRWAIAITAGISSTSKWIKKYALFKAMFIWILQWLQIHYTGLNFGIIRSRLTSMWPMGMYIQYLQDWMISCIGCGAGNSPVTSDFPSPRPVTRSFDVLFDLRLNERLCKQSRRRWF